MAQIKVLKIAADGLPLEHTAASDEITMTSFTVNGQGIVLDANGLDLNNHLIVGVQHISVQDPTTSAINATAGDLIIDDIMAKERTNVMTSAGAIQFGAISDAAGEVDSLVLPKLAGSPTAVPTAGEGSLVYDSSGDKLWLYTTSGWDDLSTVTVASNLDDSYVADGAIAIRDAVYISGADAVAPASSSAAASAQVIGFATAAAADTASVNIRKAGRLSGFSGLTPAARYYLDSTAGGISASVPSGSGNTIVQVGYAKSATVLDIQIQSLGRRA